MLHLKSVGESLVVPYGGSNIFFMIKKKYIHFLKKYDCKACLLLNSHLNAKLGVFYDFFLTWQLPKINSYDYLYYQIAGGVMRTKLVLLAHLIHSKAS